MGRAVILVGAVALVFSAPASANVRHHRARQAAPRDPVAYLRMLAPRWWNAVACGGSYAVDGRPLGMKDGAFIDAEADVTDCAITYNTSQYPTRRAIFSAWPEFCASFLHEYGHLLGYGHSADPQSVMYPVGSDATIPRACLYAPDGESFTDWVQIDGPYYFNAHP